MKKGKLYIVATPIGNLTDITLRAVDTLKNVPFILAEDTRESKKLLDRYDIPTTLVSYRDQNHNMMIEKVIEKLNMGFDLALVSDCGTPLISDPGYKLVRDLRKKEYEVIAIPGPSALIAALSVSGLPTDKFVFLGFLPKSDGKRKKLLDLYKNLDNSLVIYESPKRLFDLLDLVLDLYGDIECFLAKDISKLREKYFSGNISDVKEKLLVDDLKDNPHGEWVCIFNSSI
ncbi:MAG: 16S rRNA (cytidine(1402)-2'-O)-methyltransferase [Candidatus Dojkabacteria bacterium]